VTVPLLYPAFPDQGDPRAARGWQALLAFMSFPWRLLALAIATVAACSTTDLVQIWRDPAYKAAPVQLVLVIAVTPRHGYRLAFENALAKALGDRHYAVTTAVTAFPEGRPSRDQVAAYVRDRGVDLVVLQRIAKTTTRAYASGASYEPTSAAGDWFGNWDADAQATAGPAEYSEDSTMLVDTSVFAAGKSSKPIWEATSTTSTFKNAPDAAASSARSVTDALVRAGILAK